MTDKAMSSADVLPNKNILSIVRYGRFWAVYDNCSGCGCCEPQTIKKQTAGQLVCVTVYKKGACEVVRRLEAATPTMDEDTSKN